MECNFIESALQATFLFCQLLPHETHQAVYFQLLVHGLNVVIPSVN